VREGKPKPQMKFAEHENTPKVMPVSCCAPSESRISCHERSACYNLTTARRSVTARYTHPKIPLLPVFSWKTAK